MKKLFPAYFELSAKQTDDIWSSGIISFDTNVLNNLYRGERDIFKKFEQLVSKVEHRVWFTYQVAAELAGSMAREQRLLRQYPSDLEKTISTGRNQLVAAIEKERPALFKHKAIVDAVELAFEKMLSDAKSALKTLDLETHLKEVDAFLLSLLDSRISPAPSNSDLERLYQRGEQRYALRIPPGYEDVDKSSGNAYGDFLIWQALLDKCKAEEKHCIFVTDDTKRDWWKDYREGVTHPRLVQEFFEFTGRHYLQYSTTRFLDEVARRFKLPAPSPRMKQRINAIALQSGSAAETKLYDELESAAQVVGWNWVPDALIAPRLVVDLFEPSVKLAVEVQGTMFSKTHERIRAALRAEARANDTEIVFVSVDDILRRDGGASAAFHKIYDTYRRLKGTP